MIAAYGMSEELVTVGTAAGRIEAEILLGYLRAKGFECMLSQEAAASIYGLAVGDLARVEILALASQQEMARQIIEEYYAAQAGTDT